MKYLYIVLISLVAAFTVKNALRLIHPKWIFTFIVLVSLALSVFGFAAWITTTIPAQSDLEVIHGTVKSVSSRNSKSKDLIFIINPGEIRYEYIDWYPQHAAVREHLKEGDLVAILSGPIDPSSGAARLWSLDIHEKLDVSFRQISRARRINSNWALGVGIASAVGFLILLRVAVQCWRVKGVGQ